MTESMSSGATAQSKEPKDVLELGEHLVRELGLKDSTDTLGRWLAHHIAELIETTRKSRKQSERKEALREAVDVILKIWEHRAVLPGHANPLAKYREILAVLHQLDRTGSRLPSLNRHPNLASKIGDELRRLALEVEIVSAFPNARTTTRSAATKFLSRQELELLQLIKRMASTKSVAEKGLDVDQGKVTRIPRAQAIADLQARFDSILARLSEMRSQLERI